MAKFGVIMPVYNRPQIVLEAIRSVIDQNVPPHRLVIVDDGSTDATADRIERFLKTASAGFDVQVIRKSRGGVSSARNRAAKALDDCSVLAMLDSDDLWPADYLLRMQRAFAQMPTPVAAFADQAFVDLSTGEHRLRGLSSYASDTTRRMFLYGAPNPSGMVIREDVFRSLGGYDQNLTCSEDLYLHLRVSLVGQCVHVPGAPVQIRRRTGKSNVSAHHLTEIKDPAIGVQRVLMLERFAKADGGRRAMPLRAWREGLCRLWTEQADELNAQGRRAEATWCLQRAFFAAPWRIAVSTRLLFGRLHTRIKQPTAMLHEEPVL